MFDGVPLHHKENEFITRRTREQLLSGGDCAGTILKSHILPNVLCSGGDADDGDVDGNGDGDDDSDDMILVGMMVDVIIQR